jgi:hypothetical protein
MQPNHEVDVSSFRKRKQARAGWPAWLRVLMPFLVLTSIFALAAFLVVTFWSLHRVFHPQVTFGFAPGYSVVLIILPSFIGSMPLAMMVLNFVLSCIPPLRRIFDENAKGVPGTSFREAQKQLFKLAKIVSFPALAIAFVGALEPWAF